MPSSHNYPPFQPPEHPDLTRLRSHLTQHLPDLPLSLDTLYQNHLLAFPRPNMQIVFELSNLHNHYNVRVIRDLRNSKNDSYPTYEPTVPIQTKDQITDLIKNLIMLEDL